MTHKCHLCMEYHAHIELHCTGTQGSRVCSDRRDEAPVPPDTVIFLHKSPYRKQENHVCASSNDACVCVFVWLMFWLPHQSAGTLGSGFCSPLPACI